MIYSIASRKSCLHARELFVSQKEEFYQIGQYCTQLLKPLFTQCDAQLSQGISSYETSN